MEGYPIDPKDQALVSDPNQYGIIHGDVNLSNFFYEEAKTTLWVFDWDQIERSWFLYDLAQCLFGPWMLAQGCIGKKLEINIVDFNKWMIEGYESTCENGKVDRDALRRMIQLRMGFYETFCRRAVKEIANDEDLKGMLTFCESVVKWSDTKPTINL